MSEKNLHVIVANEQDKNKQTNTYKTSCLGKQIWHTRTRKPSLDNFNEFFPAMKETESPTLKFTQHLMRIWLRHTHGLAKHVFLKLRLRTVAAVTMLHPCPMFIVPSVFTQLMPNSKPMATVPTTFIKRLPLRRTMPRTGVISEV